MTPRPAARLGAVGTVAALVATAVALGVAALPVLGFRVVVLSGTSMEPTHPSGTALVLRPATGALEPGRVVTYRAPGGGLTTHRIVDVSADGVITRGDANPAPDPVAVRPDDVVGVAVLDLGPVSGLLATGEREGRGARLVTGVLAAAVVVRELTRIAGRRRVTPTARASAGPADHAAGGGRDWVARGTRWSAPRISWRPTPTDRGGPLRTAQWSTRAGAVVTAAVGSVVVLGVGAAHARFVHTVDVDAAETSSALLSRPTNLTATPGCQVGGGRWVDLTWDADPLDGTKDVEYEVVRDGVVRATVTDPSHRDPADVNTTYSYTVRARLGPWSSLDAVEVEARTVLTCL